MESLGQKLRRLNENIKKYRYSMKKNKDTSMLD